MYIHSGFDYLYDKVGMYDCVRGVICVENVLLSPLPRMAKIDDIGNHMLYFFLRIMMSNL